MKTMFLAMLVAIGLGLAGTGGAQAAPAYGPGIGSAVDLQNMIEQAQYRRHRYRHGPRCQTVRVCRGHGFQRRCWMERRCR